MFCSYFYAHTYITGGACSHCAEDRLSRPECANYRAASKVTPSPSSQTEEDQVLYQHDDSTRVQNIDANSPNNSSNLVEDKRGMLCTSFTLCNVLFNGHALQKCLTSEGTRMSIPMFTLYKLHLAILIYRHKVKPSLSLSDLMQQSQYCHRCCCCCFLWHCNHFKPFLGKYFA